MVGCELLAEIRILRLRWDSWSNMGYPLVAKRDGQTRRMAGSVAGALLRSDGMDLTHPHGAE
ncbi:MAG: hypothetical protein GXP29_14025 [Planctomycetes bacterium]|nr:hypothetical protein [Planctomycetota bacterium]